MSEEIAYARAYAKLHTENVRLRATLEGAYALLRIIDKQNSCGFAICAVLRACELALEEQDEEDAR